MARLCYASDRSPVAIKQSARDVSAAHPEHVGAKIETRGAIERWVDVYSNHSGANDGDDDAPVTVVDKRTNKPVIKYHGHKVKLTVRSVMTKTHREAPATVNRARQRRCRPRGRRARTVSFRRRQAELVGWLGA